MTRTGSVTKLLLRFAINTASLVVAAYIIDSVSPGAFVIADWQSALAAGLLFGVVNALIRPLLLWITCLVQVITLGLFTLVLNAGAAHAHRLAGRGVQRGLPSGRVLAGLLGCADNKHCEHHAHADVEGKGVMSSP